MERKLTEYEERELGARCEKLSSLFDELQAEAMKVLEKLPTGSQLQQRACEIQELAEALSDPDAIRSEVLDNEELDLFIDF